MTRTWGLDPEKQTKHGLSRVSGIMVVARGSAQAAPTAWFRCDGGLTQADGDPWLRLRLVIPQNSSSRHFFSLFS
jgi:hypothetical protein